MARRPRLTGMPRIFHERVMGSATSVLRGATPMLLVLAGCAPERPPEPVPEPVMPVLAPDPVPVLPGDDSIRSIGAADGTTMLVLPPRPDLQPGDLIHLVQGSTLVGTAIVTASDGQQTLARVVGLTDRRRPVGIDDRVRLASVPMPGQSASGTAVRPPPSQADPAKPAVAEGVSDEIRARLDAERAYWELAQRVLRLPAGGPELLDLQARLRRELAERHSRVP